MLNLLSKFTVEKILVYAIMLAIAIKGFGDLVSLFKEKYNQKFN